MAELRVYVTGPRRFDLVTARPIPEFDMHMILGPHRMCTVGFWCPKCHPQIDPKVFRRG